MLLIAVCAVLTGARSYAAIGDWSTIDRPADRVCGTPPRTDTIRRVVAAVNVGAVEAALTRWALTRRAALAGAARSVGPRKERRAVYAANGKTERGVRAADGTQTRLISVADHTHRLVLRDCCTDG